ncbi:hypothetical protein D9M70_648100 [compost metagenome]
MTFLFDWKVADIQTISDLGIRHLPEHGNGFIGPDVLKGFEAFADSLGFLNSQLTSLSLDALDRNSEFLCQLIVRSCSELRNQFSRQLDVSWVKLWNAD